MSFTDSLNSFKQFLSNQNHLNLIDDTDVDIWSGYVVGLAITGSKEPVASWIAELFEDEEVQQIYQDICKNPELKNRFYQGLLELRDEAVSCLLAENADELIADEIQPHWFAAVLTSLFRFFEGVKQNYSAEIEEEIMELTAPFALLAGLYDDDSEMEHLVQDEKFVEKIIALIPDNLIDLFLIFNNDYQSAD